MSLEELIREIENSSPNEWSKIHRPIFAQDLQKVSGATPSSSWIEIEEHETLYVYKPNLSISIARGLPHASDFSEPWANSFPDPKASSDWVDFRYNGMPVLRELGVFVDGARAFLPCPNSRTELTVPIRQKRIWRILNSSEERYDEYFNRAGFKAIDAPWPID